MQLSYANSTMGSSRIFERPVQKNQNLPPSLISVTIDPFTATVPPFNSAVPSVSNGPDGAWVGHTTSMVPPLLTLHPFQLEVTKIPKVKKEFCYSCSLPLLKSSQVCHIQSWLFHATTHLCDARAPEYSYPTQSSGKWTFALFVNQRVDGFIADSCPFRFNRIPHRSIPQTKNL